MVQITITKYSNVLDLIKYTLAENISKQEKKIPSLI